jgi:hypothetical protein
MTQYIVQHTGRPWASIIPDTAWFDLLAYDSLQAAQEAASDHVRDMHRTIGYNAWDDHFRVVPDTDTTISWEFVCWGPSLGPAQCKAEARAVIIAPWPERTPMPEPTLPNGWATGYLCPECAKIQKDLEDAEQRRMEADPERYYP